MNDSIRTSAAPTGSVTSAAAFCIPKLMPLTGHCPAAVGASRTSPAADSEVSGAASEVNAAPEPRSTVLGETEDVRWGGTSSIAHLRSSSCGAM